MYLEGKHGGGWRIGESSSIADYRAGTDTTLSTWDHLLQISAI